MKNFDLNKRLHIIMKITNIKNYIFPNLMALSGYFYSIHLHFYNIQTTKIYTEPWSDETIEAYNHSFNGLAILMLFIMISIIFFILSIIEYFLRKQYFPGGMIKIKFPKFIEIIHSILFWIGIWFPISRLVIAILFLILAPISEFISKFL